MSDWWKWKSKKAKFENISKYVLSDLFTWRRAHKGELAAIIEAIAECSSMFAQIRVWQTDHKSRRSLRWPVSGNALIHCPADSDNSVVSSVSPAHSEYALEFVLPPANTTDQSPVRLSFDDKSTFALLVWIDCLVFLPLSRPSVFEAGKAESVFFVEGWKQGLVAFRSTAPNESSQWVGSYFDAECNLWLLDLCAPKFTSIWHTNLTCFISVRTRNLQNSVRCERI